MPLCLRIGSHLPCGGRSEYATVGDRIEQFRQHGNDHHSGDPLEPRNGCTMNPLSGFCATAKSPPSDPSRLIW